MVSIRKWLLLFFWSSGYLVGLDIAAQPDPAIHYQIHAQLIDSTRQLKVQMEMQYVHQMQDTLSHFYLHLHANAFRHKQTPYAQHQLNQGNTFFHFMSQDDLGGYRNLRLKINGRGVQPEYWQNLEEVVDIPLEQPLYPYDTLVLEAVYVLDLPLLVEGLGYHQDQWFITHWHPRPAVYDEQGWHQMPFLGQGLDYEIPARYDVRLLVPSQYLVAGSGRLQNTSARQKLDTQSELTEKYLQIGFPPQEDSKRTDSLQLWHFQAESALDFSWAAGARFFVRQWTEQVSDTLELPCQAFFTYDQIGIWQHAKTYLSRSIGFLSRILGECPHPALTLIEAPPKAANQEYPGLSFIGWVEDAFELEQRIIHQTAEQWISCHLPLNQREHHWLDKGLSTYLELRYLSQNRAGKWQEQLPGFLQTSSNRSLEELAYLYLARRHADEPLDHPVSRLSANEAYVSHYAKPALGFRLLEKQLGRGPFESALRRFFRESGSHPDQLAEMLQKGSPASSRWFFDQYVSTSERNDYQIRGFLEEGQLKLRNAGKLALPFELTGYRDGELQYRAWHPGFTGDTLLQLPRVPVDEWVLDPQHYLPDLYRKNNSIRTRGNLKKWDPVRFRFLFGSEEDKKNDLFWSPILSWNNYDKTQLGLLIYNRTLLARKLEWAASPMFGGFFEDVRPTGFGVVRYHWYPYGKDLHRLSLGIHFRSFHFDKLAQPGTKKRYLKWAPFLTACIQQGDNNRFRHRIHLQFNHLQVDEAIFNQEGFQGLERVNNWIPRISYTLEDMDVISPARLHLMVEQQNTRWLGRSLDYIKLSLDARKSWAFQEDKHFSTRFFAGYFLLNNQRNQPGSIPQAFTLFHQGFNDYTFSSSVLGRSEQEGVFAQQVNMREGAFKNAPGSAYRNVIGQSNDLLLAVNLSTDLPIALPGVFPLEVFLDAGWYSVPESASKTSPVTWSGGVMLRYFNDGLGVYLPVAFSKDLQEVYRQSERTALFSRLTFSIDLARLHPWELLDQIRF